LQVQGQPGLHKQDPFSKQQKKIACFTWLNTRQDMLLCFCPPSWRNFSEMFFKSRNWEEMWYFLTHACVKRIQNLK
jgi:hypothetical protein